MATTTPSAKQLLNGIKDTLQQQPSLTPSQLLETLRSNNGWKLSAERLRKCMAQHKLKAPSTSAAQQTQQKPSKNEVLAAIGEIFSTQPPSTTPQFLDRLRTNYGWDFTEEGLEEFLSEGDSDADSDADSSTSQQFQFSAPASMPQYPQYDPSRTLRVMELDFDPMALIDETLARRRRARETFLPFSRLPLHIQRRIWSFALPSGPTIIEAAFSNNPDTLNPLADPNCFICTSPYAGVLEVCGRRKDPTHKISPVNLTSPAGQRETIYLRPDLDILYLPNTWRLDGPSFVEDEDNKRSVRHLALDQQTLYLLTPTQKIAAIIRCLSPDSLYAVEGDTLNSGAMASRTKSCQLTMEEVPRGNASIGLIGPWNSGRAKMTKDKYNAVVSHIAAEDGWTPPELLCRTIRREDLEFDAQVRPYYE